MDTLGLAPALQRQYITVRKEQAVTQGISDRFWQAEARTEETKQLIRDIKRITRRKFTAEEKVRIVLEGFRRDTPIRDLCRREGIRPGTYYAWLKGLWLQSMLMKHLSP